MKTKKIVATMLCALFVIGVASGCTVKAKKPTAQSGPIQSTESREDEVYGTFAIPGNARNNQIEMKVDSVEVVCWEQVDLFNTVAKRHNLIKVHVVITNLSFEDLELQPNYIRGYIDNEQLTVNNSEIAQEALGIKGDVIEQRTVHPGRSETGFVLYEYFRDWTEFEVQYRDSDLDFGIKFNENDVINLRTTAETAQTEETEDSVSEETTNTEDTSLTIPNTGNTTPDATSPVEETKPSTEPIEPGKDTVPNITIPSPKGY